MEAFMPMPRGQRPAMEASMPMSRAQRPAMDVFLNKVPTAASGYGSVHADASRAESKQEGAADPK